MESNCRKCLTGVCELRYNEHIQTFYRMSGRRYFRIPILFDSLFPIEIFRYGEKIKGYSEKGSRDGFFKKDIS